VKEDSRVTSPVSAASTTITSVAPTSPTSPSVQQPNPVRRLVLYFKKILKYYFILFLTFRKSLLNFIVKIF
jgi:hypothetical protein